LDKGESIMPNESFRSAEPSSVASHSVTDDPAMLRTKPAVDLDAVPSLAGIRRSRWETIGMVCVLAASPNLLATYFFFRTGRDLTVPFTVGELIVLTAGFWLMARGFRKGEPSRAIAGMIAIGSASVFGLSSLTIADGVGVRQVGFQLMVTDSRTGKPIPEANAAIDGAKARTNAGGEANITALLTRVSSTSLVCDVGGIPFDGVVVNVNADGYQSFVQPERIGWASTPNS
jgi:hypothetical protein